MRAAMVRREGEYPLRDLPSGSQQSFVLILRPVLSSPPSLCFSPLFPTAPSMKAILDLGWAKKKYFSQGLAFFLFHRSNSQSSFASKTFFPSLREHDIVSLRLVEAMITHTLLITANTIFFCLTAACLVTDRISSLATPLLPRNLNLLLMSRSRSGEWVSLLSSASV
jgi:hypothetical protein